MADGSITVDGGNSFLFSPTESLTSDTTDTTHDSADSHGEHADEHAHHITDFGIGTLVLAMCLGAASRTYLTHVTG